MPGFLFWLVADVGNMLSCILIGAENLKLLVIGYVWPEPKSSAAGWRMLQLIGLFQQQGYHVVFASPAQDSEHAIDFAEHQMVQQRIALNCASFDEYVQQLQPDVVMFDRFMMEEQFGWRVAKYCPQAIRILDTEDLHCLREARQQQVKQQGAQQLAGADNSANGSEAALLSSDLALREVAAIFRSDLNIMISEIEIQLLQQQCGVPAELLCYLPFFVDQPDCQQWPELADKQHFVSIGNFRHEPNWDAVLVLKQQVWPKIRERLPQAQLHVYGAYPPKKATDLHNAKQGFLVKGWAEDALAVLAQARVLLAPLRFGAGQKGKFIDAMRVGTPSVTTSIGTEAMLSSDQQWPGAVSDDWQDFAAQAVALYQQPDAIVQAQQAGLRLLQQNFAQESATRAFWQQFALLTSDLNTLRQRNFIGRMLQHHTMKSTQYMAQWIAAKNRPHPALDTNTSATKGNSDASSA